MPEIVNKSSDAPNEVMVTAEVAGCKEAPTETDSKLCSTTSGTCQYICEETKTQGKKEVEVEPQPAAPGMKWAQVKITDTGMLQDGTMYAKDVKVWKEVPLDDECSQELPEECE